MRLGLREMFRRVVTSGRRFIPEIDGLRFIAIAVVVLHHSRVVRLFPHPEEAGRLNDLLEIGRHGVQLFFVISGFLLALPFARTRLCGGRPVSVKTYFYRRLTRLEPPYVLLLLIAYVLFVAAHGRGDLSLWKNLLAGLVYQHSSITGEANVLFMPAWSLEVEVQFYVLTPLLTWVFAIRPQALRRATLVAALVGAAALSAVVPPSVSRYHLSVLGNFQYFFAGYLLADLFIVDWKEQLTRSSRWDLVTIGGWPLLVLLFLSGGWAAHVLSPLLVLALYVAALRGKVTSWAVSRPAITAIGGMCYTIYLVHSFVLGAMSRVAQPLLPAGAAFATRWLVYLAVALPAVLLVSAIYFVVVERPCMNPEWPSLLAERARRLLGAPALKREKADVA